jgi:S1-C subfamily serine protease
MVVDVEESVVQVITTHSEVDYVKPWNFAKKSYSTGSGFAVNVGDKQYILTNAHCVKNSWIVSVRKKGTYRLYKAKIISIMHECDLALLSADCELKSLMLDELPTKLSKVLVYGYPLGGHNISITKGVVSRIQMFSYPHSTNIAIQIDAAINFGNSGGPVVNENGKVVGVAFAGESFLHAENMGYIIPAVLVKFFLETVEKGKKFEGLCTLGVKVQDTTEQIKKYFNVKETGVLISKIYELGSSYGILKPMDVITHIDGFPIDDNGTMKLSDIIPVESDDITYYGTMLGIKHPGTDVLVSIIRDKKPKKMTIKLKPVLPNYGLFEYQTPVSYYIVLGVVFLPLTKVIIHEKEDNKEDMSDVDGIIAKYNFTKKDERLILVSEVINNEIFDDRDRSFTNKIVESVNGKKVLNLENLRDTIKETKEEYVVIRFMNTDKIIILKTSDIKKHNKKILLDNLGNDVDYYVKEVEI